MVDSLNMLDKQEYPDHIDLSNNNLKNNNFKHFLKNLRKTIIKFNLSNNNLGVSGSKMLLEWFED